MRPGSDFALSYFVIYNAGMIEDGPEKIVIVGFGWVGQANALALAADGFDVSFFDTGIPKRHYAQKFNRLYGSLHQLENILEIDSDRTVYVVSVGDRVSEEGVQDISLIKKALDALRGARGTVVLRATVLPQRLSELKFDFYVPEFLHELKAVEECIKPHFFVVGSRGTKPEPSFFETWRSRTGKVFVGTPEEASYVKYLSNVWNSLRIAFVNEFGDAIEEPKTEEVRNAIERVLDFVLERKSYLKYGRSFSGHCLPKDTRAFMGAYPNAFLVRAAHESNNAHREVEKRYNTLPEWFSFWETDVVALADTVSFTRFIWTKFQRSFFVRILRRLLKKPLFFVEELLPEPSLERSRRIWDALAEENARYYVNTKTKSGERVDEFELRETGERDVRTLILEDKVLLDALHAFEDKKVLELGSGIGRMTEFLAPHFAQVHGVELSPRMLKIANRRTHGQSNVTLSLGDGLTLQDEDSSFDLVFSYLTFQYLPTLENSENYIRELSRVLKPGGIAKIQVRTGPKVHRWRWSYGVSLGAEELETMARIANLRVLETLPSEEKFMWVWLQK